MAHLEQLQCMNGGSKRKAVAILARNWRLLHHRLDSLSDKFEYVQQISGALPTQAATMVGSDAIFLTRSKTTLDAAMKGLLGVPHDSSKSPLTLFLIMDETTGAINVVRLCKCKKCKSRMPAKLWSLLGYIHLCQLKYRARLHEERGLQGPHTCTCNMDAKSRNNSNEACTTR